MKVALLSLIICLVAVARGSELLQNPDMTGCENGNGSPLSIWSGGSISLSLGPNSYYFLNVPADHLCYALLDDYLTTSVYQTITVPADGNYDFNGVVTCQGQPTDSCDFTLSINSINIPLTGATAIPGAAPSPFVPISALNFFLSSGTYDFVFSFAHSVGASPTGYMLSLSLAATGSGSGDPHMVGFQGQRFDYIGEAGQVINLLTDPDLQVNTLLNLQQIGLNSFLSGPMMMEMAFMTRGHTVIINAGGHEREQVGFVSVDGVLLPLGHSFLDGLLSVSFTSLNANSHQLGLTGNDHIAAQVNVKLEDMYEFRVFLIENGKDQLHSSKWLTEYARRFLDFNASLLDLDRRPHGILGQTAAPLSKQRSIEQWDIEGTDSDYIVKDGLTGSRFTFNKF